VRKATFFLLTALLLTSCNLRSQGVAQDTPEAPAATPVVVSGSISGRVWSDLCDPASASPAPPGCVALDTPANLRANGILEGGESGIAGVTVWLGAGACPAPGLASAATASDGSYQFTGLGAGTYCVWVDPARGPEGRPLLAGAWSFPPLEDPDGMASITTTLGPGEARAEVSFGWDYLDAPSPTAGPRPTDTPSAAEDPRSILGDPAWRDPLDVEDNWPMYEDSHVGFTIAEGRMTMTSFDDDNWDGWMLTWPEIGDFYLEATFSPGSCEGLDRYGLMFRARPSVLGYTGYLFAASCDGRYSLRAWDGSSFRDLVSWTPSDAIPQGSGEAVRLGVWAEGDELRLYADGELLAERADDMSSNGLFGVFLAANRTSGFEVSVDEIASWSLP
jgi:hypothetical protein